MSALSSDESSDDDDTFEFDSPDKLREAIPKCRDPRYRKAYLRWLRYGPDEARDANKFNTQWEQAGATGQPAVAKYYLDERARRQIALTHHKSDVLTFYTIMLATAALLATIAPDGIKGLVGASRVAVGSLLLIALAIALASYTNKLLYPLYTHFVGVAENGYDVVHEKSYINRVRKEGNQIGRTLQRGRRLFSLSKLLIYMAVIYLIVQYVLK